MVKTLFAVILSSAALLCADGQVPRQFRVWGRKAPEKLSNNPLPGKVGIESIRIPADMVKIQPDTPTALPENAAQKYNGMIPFPYHPMKKMYSVTAPGADKIGLPARSIATPGEYTQLGFAFYAVKPLSCIEVALTSFKNKAGNEIIPLYFQDLRRVMDLPVPKEDNAKQYVIEPRYLESFDEFDVLSVSAGRCERFFLTVKVPDDAPAGIVRAKATFKARTGEECEIELAIRILPFKLMQPNPETEMTFMMLSGINDVRYNSWGRDRQPQLALRQLADLAEHGMTGSCYEHSNPFVTGTEDGKLTLDFEKPGMSGFYSLNDFIHLVNRGGLTGPFCTYNGPWEWAQFLVPGVLKYPKYSDKYNSAIRQLTSGIEEQRAKMGWQKFIYVIGDEPAHNSERMNLSANCGRQILAACPNVDVTNFFNGMHSGIKDWKLMRDAVTINNANFFNEEVLRETKELGLKHWNYNSVGRYPVDYRGERIAFGFLPWRLKSTGVSQYALREFGNSSKNVEFVAYDHINYGRSDYDFTYPAADGPIPTQQWEAIRQGVYDYRYLYTLKKIMAEIPEEKIAEMKAELEAVEQSLPLDYATPKRAEYLENYPPEALDAWRWRISQAIMKVQKIKGTK